MADTDATATATATVGGKRVLIVVSHPEEKSFVCALAKTAVDTLTAAGHSVVGASSNPWCLALSDTAR